MIKFKGFDRVVINEHGVAYPPERASQLGVEPDVGFLRNDGWSLAAPKHLENVAFDLWEDDWTHVINKGDLFWKPLKK